MHRIEIGYIVSFSSKQANFRFILFPEHAAPSCSHRGVHNNVAHPRLINFRVKCYDACATKEITAIQLTLTHKEPPKRGFSLRTSRI